MKRTRRSRVWVLAAVICALAALSIAAAATGFFGLRDILMPEQGTVNVIDNQGVVVPGEYEKKDFVSLSGLQDTPESKALAEWQSFLDGYDTDGSIIAQIGNGPTGLEDRYGEYLVYTREMADKLDEIVEKYGLLLHSRLTEVMPATWPTAVGNFCRENVIAYTGYIYENGTFRFDGDAGLEGYGLIEYQFSRSVRGTFDEVSLNINSASDFREWGYETADGTRVTLGLGKRNRSLIMADLGESFVLVNVLTGEAGDDTFSAGPIGQKELEALADSFDFSALKTVRQPDFDAIARENEAYLAAYNETLYNQPIGTSPEEPEDPVYTRTGIRSDVAREFVLILAQRIEDGEKQAVAGMFTYPLRIETAEGTYTADTPEELLEHYDETIGKSALSLTADMTWDPTPRHVFSDGSGLASAANGTVWFGLVEESVIRIFTLQTDQWSIRAAGSSSEGDEIYDHTGIETDAAKAFVWDLEQLLVNGDRQAVAELFVYPCAVWVSGKSFTVNTPEELLEYYDEAIENRMGDLAAKLDYHTVFARDGMVGVSDGAIWFGLVEDGKIRVFSLWTGQGQGVGPVVGGVSAG